MITYLHQDLFLSYNRPFSWNGIVHSALYDLSVLKCHLIKLNQLEKWPK